MKTKLLLYCLVLTISINAQQQAPEQTSDSGTIDDQFNYLIDNSNNYKDKKIVRFRWLDALKNSVNDSLNELKTEVETLNQQIVDKDSQIKNLTESLDNTNANVTQLNKEKDSIVFFGALISKPLYNTILWTIIAVLLGTLIIYIIRFNRSNSITQETKNKFDELEHEYEGFRQRSLEREQQIRRKLQDEINKQKKDK